MTKTLKCSPDGSLPFDSETQRVFLHLWRTYDLLKAIEDKCLSNFGLSAQQYNVLRILQASHPESMPTMQLGSQLISRGPDMTRMLDRLHSKKLVQRSRPSGNRRVVEVGITPAGLALLADMDGAVIEMHDRQLGHLSDGERNRLIRLLKVVRRPHENVRMSGNQ